MNWFFIAIFAPIFWSINTHFDKFILSKYNKERGIESVFFFSTLFSVLFSLLILIFKHNEIFFYSGLQNLFLFLLPGFFNALGLYFYLQSLKTEESSIIVALFQLTPVFAYFLGFFILGEILTQNQILASLIILIGASILSLNLEKGEKISIKIKTVGLISLSALFFAFNDVLFKKYTIYQGSFITSLFWQHVGIFIIGTCFFLFLKQYRGDFLLLLKNNHKKLLFLNGLNELFYILGNLISNFATLFAPVALILVINSYQTVFTFIIGISLTLFLPHIITEKISRHHLVQRILAIGIILLGSYFLYLS